MSKGGGWTWSIDGILKAWLAFTILQLAGPIVMAYTNPSSLASQMLPGATPAHLRSHALTSALLLLIRVCLLVQFDCTPLHAMHAASSALSLAFMATEMFLFSQRQPTAVFVNIAFSATNVIVWTIFWGTITAEKSPPPRKGPRRLFAKHYMEGDMFSASVDKKDKDA